LVQIIIRRGEEGTTRFFIGGSLMIRRREEGRGNSEEIGGKEVEQSTEHTGKLL
jgi:hypothetical protein